jgi:hypothetical protein
MPLQYVCRRGECGTAIPSFKAASKENILHLSPQTMVASRWRQRFC